MSSGCIYVCDRPAILLRNAGGEQVFYVCQVMGKLHMPEFVVELRIFCDNELARETLPIFRSLHDVAIRRNMFVLAMPDTGVRLLDGVLSGLADIPDFAEDVPAVHVI